MKRRMYFREAAWLNQGFIIDESLGDWEIDTYEMKLISSLSDEMNNRAFWRRVYFV
jgi:hypothetical protein